MIQVLLLSHSWQRLKLHSVDINIGIGQIHMLGNISISYSPYWWNTIENYIETEKHQKLFNQSHKVQIMPLALGACIHIQTYTIQRPY